MVLYICIYYYVKLCEYKIIYMASLDNKVLMILVWFVSKVVIFFRFHIAGHLALTLYRMNNH